MDKKQKRNKTKLIALSLLVSLFLQILFPLTYSPTAKACCDETTEAKRVPACFLVDSEPKIQQSIDSVKSLVKDLQMDFMDAAQVVDNIEALAGNAEANDTQIQQEVREARKKYNDLREKVGARKGAGDTKDEPDENSLIGKLREIFDRYKVKEKGEFKPRLEESKKILNTLARASNILRALIRRLKFENSRDLFREVDTVSNQLLTLLEQSVENINISVNNGVCLWEVIDDDVSPTTIEPEKDKKKKRLPVGTEIRTPAKQREAGNDLNSKLVEASGRIADPDECKFHHAHGTFKSKSDPDEGSCGHGSVDNTDIECPNCPALQIERIKISESTSEGECVLFKVPEGMGSVARDPRSEYPEWLKQLICTYLETDFSNDANIEAFAAIAFAAFRANVADRVSADENIVHIVGRRPAILISRGTKLKPKKIKTPTVKRSVLTENKAAVGITRTVRSVVLFGRKKPPKTEAGQRKLLPIAENAIIYLFLLKKAGDIFATNTQEQLKASKTQFEREVVTATNSFKNEIVTASKTKVLKPNLNVDDAPAVDTSGSGGDTGGEVNLDASNFFEDVGLGSLTVNRKKVTQFKPSELPAGSPLGVTVPLTSVRSPRFFKGDSSFSREDGLESIEPIEKFKPKKVIKVAVRTLIHMLVANGRPVFQRFSGKKALGKPSFTCAGNCIVVKGIKIVSNDGERDLTELIKTHELQHVSDTFSAWKEQVIDQIKAQLNSSSLDASVIDKTVSVEVNSIGKKRNAVDIIATYLVSEEVKESDFRAQINALISRDIINGFIQNFKVEKDNKADAFHGTAEGSGLTGEEGVTVDGRPLDPVEDTSVKDPKK